MLYSDVICALALALAVLTVLGLLPPLMRSAGIGGLPPAKLLSLWSKFPIIGISTISIFDLLFSFLSIILIELTYGVSNWLQSKFLVDLPAP